MPQVHEDGSTGPAPSAPDSQPPTLDATDDYGYNDDDDGADSDFETYSKMFPRLGDDGDDGEGGSGPEGRGGGNDGMLFVPLGDEKPFEGIPTGEDGESYPGNQRNYYSDETGRGPHTGTGPTNAGN